MNISEWQKSFPLFLTFIIPNLNFFFVVLFFFQFPFVRFTVSGGEKFNCFVYSWFGHIADEYFEVIFTTEIIKSFRKSFVEHLIEITGSAEWFNGEFIHRWWFSIISPIKRGIMLTHYWFLSVSFSIICWCLFSQFCSFSFLYFFFSVTWFITKRNEWTEWNLYGQIAKNRRRKVRGKSIDMRQMPFGCFDRHCKNGEHQITWLKKKHKIKHQNTSKWEDQTMSE